MTAGQNSQVRVVLLGFTVPDDLFDQILGQDAMMPVQTHTFAWALVRSLRAANCPVHLLSTAPVTSWPGNRQLRFRSGTFRQGGVDGQLLGFVNALGLKHVTRFGNVWRQGTRVLREQKADVLLVHGVHSPFLWFGALRGRRLGVRVVPVLTDPPSVVLPTDGRLVRSLRRLDRVLVRAALARCSGVIALTEALAEDFAPDLPRLVMEGIFDPVGTGSGATDRATPAPATREVVYAGGLSRAYGVDRLVEAFRGLPAPDLRLRVYGRGELEQWLREQAAVDPRIAPPELLPRETLLPRLARAAVLVNPRPVGQDFVRWSFPSKLIEYLSTGVPVVTTRLPGIPGDYAPWLVLADTDTAEGLREAVDRALRLPSEERVRIGLGGADFVRETRGAAAQGRRMRDFLAARLGPRAEVPARRVTAVPTEPSRSR
ncbi:glycosyltransferase family 4 protein [Micromonospora sp. CPCC 205546]|uniref:glycosyltransferase family 4 protein n=1 Tax=Micromonospora sp. CPCC 205546 TaxID=3122397 RepID=UPI002FF05710